MQILPSIAPLVLVEGLFNATGNEAKDETEIHFNIVKTLILLQVSYS